MSRPGPRIGEAVELAAKTVNPDLFNQLTTLIHVNKYEPTALLCCLC
ncbi:hypothetical protein [Peribacillus simplex]